MKRPHDLPRSSRGKACKPVIEGEVCVNQIDRFPLHEPAQRGAAPVDRPGILLFRDDPVGEFVPEDLVFEQPASDIGETRVDPATSQRGDLAECDRRGASPLVKRCEMQNSQQ